MCWPWLLPYQEKGQSPTLESTIRSLSAACAVVDALNWTSTDPIDQQPQCPRCHHQCSPEQDQDTTVDQPARNQFWTSGFNLVFLPLHSL